VHPEVRQRFTIAHELGHWRLHGKKEVIVDHLVRIDFRDDRASAATHHEEIQANAFAAELLMPSEFILLELKKRGLSEAEGVGEVVEDLAERFEVSQQAMEYRLVNLGLRGHV
jgi:Zn-dependent peptidase ImmA (M78 family)